MTSRLPKPFQARSGLAIAGAAIVSAAVAIAAWVEHHARRAVRVYTPEGQFIEIDGVRQHDVERHEGPAVRSDVWAPVALPSTAGRETTP